MWVAATLVAVAIPLQMLGFTSTCTQGADGTYLTGAVLSAPLLLAAALLAFRLGLASVRMSNSLLPSVAITLGLAVVLVALNVPVWLNVLLFGTPFGDFYSFYPANITSRLIVLASYLALPLVVVLATAWVLLRR